MYAGIDVSKSYLDVKRRDWEKTERFSNDSKGIEKLVKRLSGSELVVMESTGGYEREVAKALSVAQLKVAIMNPWRTHNFAKGLGIRAKTDKIDAEILSLFAELMKPKPTSVLSDEEYELKQLIIRRIQLKNQQTQEKNRLEHADGAIKKSIHGMIKAIGAQVKAITKLLKRKIQERRAMKERMELLLTAKGVGDIVGASLCALLPELGNLSRREIAALVGVAPFNKDSGNSTGERSITGGRAEIRTMLYMATLTAIRSNTRIKTFYKKLLSKGKKKKVALVACMRKFLVRLNAMVMHGEGWKDSVIVPSPIRIQ